MVKLNEISKARDNDDPDQVYELWKQWHSERGIPHEVGSHRAHYMRYIQTLEDDRRHLLASVMQLLQIARAEKDYQKSIIMKAQYLLTVMHDAQQHEREAAQ